MMINKIFMKEIIFIQVQKCTIAIPYRKKPVLKNQIYKYLTKNTRLLKNI